MVISTTIGNTGGVQAVTLATAQIPSHTHAISPTYQAGGDAGIASAGGEGGTSRTTGSAGGSGAHSNIPPVIIVNYVIKT